MESADIKALIAKAVQPDVNQAWADLGSGNGAFALALRELAGPQVVIYCVDKDPTKLAATKEAFRDQFGASYEIDNRHFLQADFTQFHDLPLLDGILMANTLHFVKDQAAFLKNLALFLKPDGKLVVVEYDTDRENPFVPYPLSFKTFSRIAEAADFAEPVQLATAPSKYQGQMYSALAKIK